MPDAGLSKQVQRFLADHIVSVEQLEILLLLSNSPQRSWSVDEVFQAIQSSRTSITERLEGLVRQRLLKKKDEAQTVYCFEPATEELRVGVSALKAAYRERRVKIIETIFSQPEDPVRRFADAFKLRKDK